MLRIALIAARALVAVSIVFGNDAIKSRRSGQRMLRSSTVGVGT